MLISSYRILYLVASVLTLAPGLAGQRMYTVTGLSFSVDEGDGSITSRAWTHTIASDVNEWATVEAYASNQIAIGQTVINQSSSWDNCGSGCSDITLNSQVSTLGTEYVSSSDHFGRVRDMMWQYTESSSRSDQRSVALPPSVTLAAIDASNGSNLIFSYIISAPVFYSTQLTYGPYVLISADYHPANVTFTLNRGDFAGINTSVKFSGSMYGQTFTYHTCPVVSSNTTISQSATSIVPIPMGQPPGGYVASVSVGHNASMADRSVKFCQQPVGYASHYTIDLPVASSSLDTGMNGPGLPKEMVDYLTVEEATFPMEGTQTMPVNGQEAQSTTYQPRKLSNTTSWLEWGSAALIQNYSVAFWRPSGLFIYGVGGFGFTFQQ